MSGMTSSPGGDVVQRRSASALERTIAGQPEAVSQAITSNIDKLRAAMAIVAGARRVRLTGAGASFYAAQVGEHMLRAIGVNAIATTAFDLATYTTGFEPGDAVIVISHRGTTRYPLETLQRAMQSGLKTIAITGLDSPMEGADVVINTVAQEESGTPSASTTGSMAVIAAIAARFEPHSDLASAVPTIPESLRSMRPSRQTASQIAGVASDPARRIVIAGAGGLNPIARLGAFGVKVASYSICEGMHTEEAIHGGLQALNADDLLVHLAPSGPAVERHADLAMLAESVGIQRWKLGGDPDKATWHTPLPNVPEVIAPILASIPLQWLALEIALARETNPDSFRRDDPLFDRAYARIEP
ncbi:MAG TPA: SIS domain-containing protein [Thermomicrobiales bacterium]|nr:SIS domain-containing protein [Thermomicrobiales bacterium]